VLVIGSLAGARNGDGWFTNKDVTDLVRDLRLPGISNLGRNVVHLVRGGFIRPRGKPAGWSLTPSGRIQVRDLMGELDPSEVQLAIATAGGALLGDVVQALIDPALAPKRWSASIKRLLDRYPFENNVFCMTRFQSNAADTTFLDPIRDVIDVARAALDHHHLHLHLASDRALDDDLFANVAAHMWACKYGIGLFEDRGGKDRLNYKVVIEVGSMLMTGRRCALLKDKGSLPLPTDFVGHIYKEVDFADHRGVARELHAWAAHDLGLGLCSSCPNGTAATK
jgi:hypothetical protein